MNTPVQHTRVYTLYYSFYFDGTGNNNFNTEEHNDAPDVLKSEIASRGRSYTNDFSNIARQWRKQIDNNSGSDVEIVKKFYTEGIGTRTGGQDSDWQSATGLGSTGVSAKCRSALDDLKSELSSIGSNQDCRSINLHVDVFGFSRGAAAARYFVHVVQEDRLSEAGKPINKTFRFAGLYDTVASWGLPVTHRFGTMVLHLNRMSLPSKVVQYAAADEHRANFSLTNINSGGTQYYVPGVHSDIGGGYNDGENEELLLRKGREDYNADMQYLIAQGYFLPNEISIDTDPPTWGINSRRRGESRLESNRAGISNEYSKAILHLMVDDVLTMSPHVDFLTGKFRIQDRNIESVYSALASLKTPRGITLDYWTNQSVTLGTLPIGTLRNRYCHFSAHVSGALSPHEPNLVNRNTTRRRHVYPG